DGTSWSNTVSSGANPALACLASPSGTCAEATSTFVDARNPNPSTYPLFAEIRDGTEAPGSIVYTNPGGNSSNGFTADGRRCDTFTPSGNDACPIQYRFNI